jgi:hypothetical protein
MKLTPTQEEILFDTAKCTQANSVGLSALLDRVALLERRFNRLFDMTVGYCELGKHQMDKGWFLYRTTHRITKVVIYPTCGKCAREFGKEYIFENTRATSG